MVQLDTTATGFQLNITAGYTQAQFITWVKDCFTNCGFPTPTETVGNNPKILCYEIVLAAGATHGTIAFCVEIPTFTTGSGTSFRVYLGLFSTDNYNTTTLERTTQYTGAADIVSPITNQRVSTNSYFDIFPNRSYLAFNFPLATEMPGMHIKDTTTGEVDDFFGFYRPALINPNWDANLYCTPVALPSPNTPNLLSTSAAITVGYIPYPVPTLSTGSGSAATYQDIAAWVPYDLSSTNSWETNAFEVIKGPPLWWADTRIALLGQFSADIVIGPMQHFSQGAIVQVDVGVEEYFVVEAKTLGWAIRRLIV